ncbi:MAG: DUF1156 domain-containing protein [Planctomycetota bacterium]|nr:MAG: DUF1156 domain-containing protein [Planctomycetota bacterium]
MTATHTRKKLIEVALPLEAINKACAREKSIRHGHPSTLHLWWARRPTLHLWWARRPLAAARAVIFSQMVDDPSASPDLFPTQEAQDAERQRLFRIIEELVLWESTTNEKVLDAARDEIKKSWRRTCAQNAEHPRALELFDANKLPAFHDPFAGGGALPLEAQRLGLESYASDLNPVAVLINKAMIEIPPKFAGRAPINPDSRGEPALLARQWKGAQGLAEDVRYYGKWMRDEAEKRIGHLYPKIEVTAEMVKVRPDLKQYVGRELTVIAWLWARTVKSPNPAFSKVDVPLASTFMLSTKEGKEAYVLPVIEDGGYRFTVKVGKPKDAKGAKSGTKLSRANFGCLMSGAAVSGDYIKEQGKAQRIGARLMAIVAEGDRGRVYLGPTPAMEAVALTARPTWKPDGAIATRMTGGNCTPYGLTSWGDLFTPRQLVALTTFSDLVQEARERVQRDALAAGMLKDGKSLNDGGVGAAAYADAVGVYLACGISRSADFWSSLCIWANQPKNELVMHLFGRQAIPMAWDFAEANPFSGSGGNFLKCLSYVTMGIDHLAGAAGGSARQLCAAKNALSTDKVVSTDPPYYDNIGYADLSDYFYVWLRRSLAPVFPALFTTVAVPKAEELVATPYRHGSKDKAEKFFLAGMTLAMHRLAEQAHPAFPVTIYYAFKQSETDDDEGVTNTGWDTFLEAVLEAGLAISGTLPMRTERKGRMIGNDTNALASSIILVCRKQSASAPTTTRRAFVNTLKSELPSALAHLQRGNIAPVDLAQAAIGPGMAVYTRYSKVLDTDGSALSVRQALALINQTLDESLAEQEGEFDADSRFAMTWFEQYAFEPAEFGIANTLASARNARAGKVRLLKREELHRGNPLAWNPATDTNLSVWEAMQHMIHRHTTGGASAAGELLRELGSKADHIKDLAYRLHGICSAKKWTQEQRVYNALVAEWADIVLASQSSSAKVGAGVEAGLFDGDGADEDEEAND